MEVRARGSINPCQLENLRQGGVVKKKKTAGHICTSECYCVCILYQPRVNPETLARVYHLFPKFFLVSRCLRGKGYYLQILLRRLRACPCVKSHESHRLKWERRIQQEAFCSSHSLLASLSPLASVHYASASSPPLVCWRTSSESPTRFCHSYHCSHLGALVASFIISATVR